MTLLASIGGTVFLYMKDMPNSAFVQEYNGSMKNSMNVLLILWITIILGMNFLIHPLFKGIVNKIIDLPSINKYPMIRSAFCNIQYNIEGLIKLIRPVSVITLLVGNFVALFLNTKLLIDGRNSGAYLDDLIVSLVFVFGAPIIISLSNIVTSVCLFRIKTKAESELYYFSGCTPKWIFNLKLVEIGTVALISSSLTLFGTFLFAIPLLRVTYLGGGNIFQANWNINILLTFGAFLLFFICFSFIYWRQQHSTKAYLARH
ncbi:hypothetical protein [Enterococcus durans]|uniref:hypothetical protein n=1 Tax=Enterococcus durans TaxID=53345 RepID=UPI0021A4AE50|nr:hypothetical protein [Enterococcus durans]